MERTFKIVWKVSMSKEIYWSGGIMWSKNGETIIPSLKKGISDIMRIKQAMESLFLINSNLNLRCHLKIQRKSHADPLVH